MFAFNHPETHVLGVPGTCGDVRRIKGNDLIDLAGLRNKGLDLLVGCPPCQGFSMRGARNSEDKRNNLYREFVRLVEETNPKAFVFENVPGIAELYGGRFLVDLRRRLEELDYVTAIWRLRASDLGVPQSRERIFVVGLLRGNKLGRPPSKRRTVTVWEAIGDLPVAGFKTLPPRSAAIEYKRSPLSGYSSLLRGKNASVTGCELTRHSRSLIKRFRHLKWNRIDRPTHHRRLHPDFPAPTLTAGSRSMTACRPVHPFANRVLTVREAARLMSFPDWFQFPPETAEAWSQIGNAVPPLMAKAVFSRIRSFLE
jgi:DNA (cytosine-5)-methyltransferase 1